MFSLPSPKYSQIFVRICLHFWPNIHRYLHFLPCVTHRTHICISFWQIELRLIPNVEEGWLFCTVISSAWHPIMTSCCMQKIGSVVMRYQLTCKYLHLLFKQTLAANKYYHYRKTYKYVHLCLCKIVGSCHGGDLLLRKQMLAFCLIS